MRICFCHLFSVAYFATCILSGKEGKLPDLGDVSKMLKDNVENLVILLIDNSLKVFYKSTTMLLCFFLKNLYNNICLFPSILI